LITKKLTSNTEKYFFTCINPVNLVLKKIIVFYPKWLETHFLSRLTWFDSYWPDGLWSEIAWNSFCIPVDMVWLVLTWWTRFWPKMLILIQNGMKLIFYPNRYGLIRIDLMNSFFMEKCGWPKKNIFLNFNFFFNFFRFF
jgi:hypothetical protein